MINKVYCFWIKKERQSKITPNYFQDYAKSIKNTSTNLDIQYIIMIELNNINYAFLLLLFLYSV